MQTRILHIFTRTPLHIGAGSSIGAVDQPVIRERHTGFPFIPGSSLKGVLRDHMNTPSGGDLDAKAIDEFFGQGGDTKVFEAGKISFGEGKLLAFPVRSAKGAFALATSNLALERYAREAGLPFPTPPTVKDGECLAGNKTVLSDTAGGKGVVIEEYRFKVAGDFPAEWETHLSGLLNDAVLKGAIGRFVVLSDGDFSHFALNSCPIQQHVRINDETGTADDGGLFNEEVVPSEALFFAPLTTLRKADVSNPVFAALAKEQLLQLGGNGTIGLGYCTIKLS